jgi:hypothetical protein
MPIAANAAGIGGSCGLEKLNEPHGLAQLGGVSGETETI